MINLAKSAKRAKEESDFLNTLRAPRLCESNAFRTLTVNINS
jgi:hypothetical protein